MATFIEKDEDLNSRVQNLARIQHRSPRSILREAVVQYLAREEARNDFAKEAEASWQSYQQTGLHLSGNEVAAWLNSWGAETETDLPDFHR